MTCMSNLSIKYITFFMYKTRNLNLFLDANMRIEETFFYHTKKVKLMWHESHQSHSDTRRTWAACPSVSSTVASIVWSAMYSKTNKDERSLIHFSLQYFLFLFHSCIHHFRDTILIEATGKLVIAKLKRQHVSLLHFSTP